MLCIIYFYTYIYKFADCESTVPNWNNSFEQNVSVYFACFGSFYLCYGLLFFNHLQLMYMSLVHLRCIVNALFPFFQLGKIEHELHSIFFSYAKSKLISYTTHQSRQYNYTHVCVYVGQIVISFAVGCCSLSFTLFELKFQQIAPKQNKPT